MISYNYVLIFKDGIVPELPYSERNVIIHESAQGWRCAIGSWEEEDIKGFEYYSLKDSWIVKSGWEMVVL